MPGFIAKKLCPQLVIVPTNFHKYRQVSNDVRTILAQYDASYSPMSLDEAYLNFTDHLKSRASLSDDERTYAKVVDDVAYCSCMARRRPHTATAGARCTRFFTINCAVDYRKFGEFTCSLVTRISVIGRAHLLPF